MSSIISFISGKKTYGIAIAMLIVAYYNGDMEMALEGLALITGRAAIAKVEAALFKK